MNVQLHPDIKDLDIESLCYSIYSQLYHSFFNAQDKKDDEHPWGITEGDETSVRLRNTAYGFAEAIAGTASGELSGGISGTLLDYLKKTGGDMTGMLRSNYGFEAGTENTRILETFQRDDVFGVKITGNLELGENNLFIGGKQLLSYEKKTGTVILTGGHISFEDSFLKSNGVFIFGKDKETGVFISPETILLKGKNIYHEGNANLETVDWNMKNGSVSENLSVQGQTKLNGLLTACQGAELGFNGKPYISVENQKVSISTFLSFNTGYGIKINNIPVLLRVNETDIQLGAVGGELLIGSGQTAKTRLLSNISDIDGDYVLLSKYGAAYFTDSLTVRHSYGDMLLSSYRVDTSNEGMIIHKSLRFGTSHGAWFEGKENGIGFHSFVEHISSEDRKVFYYETLFKYGISTSRYQPQNKISDSLFISTEADFFSFDKPIESKSFVGIDNSFTRLTDGSLFFTNEHYLLSATDGIKHYGNSYFLSDLSSEKFSSGFAGSGWAIIHNKTTGNIAATFDELTIRKKMRIYELEVQKISATNGSLWVSDNCSGDTVIKL